MSEYEYAESGVLLTFRELTLLLQSVGVRYINGFCLSESEISDEEVIQLIGSLVRKGILKTSDTEFYMEDMVEKMIRCIGCLMKIMKSNRKMDRFIVMKKKNMHWLQKSIR